MSPDLIRSWIAAAALAPSVHNVQPARWRIEDDGATLFEATSRRLPAADPRGLDAAMSLGAAVEGFRLAAGQSGHGVTVEQMIGPVEAGLRPVARLRIAGAAQTDPLATWVPKRQSWRGAFQPPTPADRAAAMALRAEDAAVLADPAVLAEAGRRLDQASWGYMKQDGFRGELVSWMRLSKRHASWARDGLNADAMAMGPVAAWGAGLVLGPLFAPLARVGLAQPLLAEGGRLAGDAAIVLFHRPKDEDRFDSGAAFYRLWLRIDAAGFGAGVLAALADDLESAQWAHRAAGLDATRHIVSAFRMGRRPAGADFARARLPLDELIVPTTV